MTARSSVSRIVLRAWPAVLALWAVAGQAADPSELLAAIRDGRARPDLAVRAAGFRFTTGSVRPLTMPMTGASSMPGRNWANRPSRAPSVLACAMRENHSSILSE